MQCFIGPQRPVSTTVHPIYLRYTLTWARKCNQLFLILHKIHSQVQIQHAQSYGSVLILYHQIGVRGALLPDSPSAPIPYESQNYTISDKITPLWKRICEPPEIQIGCYWGDSRSTASLGLIMRFFLIDCNRSSFVSLKFPFTFILAGTIVDL